MPSYQYYFIIVIPDAIDFHAPVKLGHIIHLTGRVTFTSNKSMEIEVVVDAKDYLAGKEISRPLHVVTLNIVIIMVQNCLTGNMIGL